MMMGKIYPCNNPLLADVQMLFSSAILSKLKGESHVDVELFSKLKGAVVEEESDIIHG